MQTLTNPAQVNAPLIVNENFETVAAAGIFGKRHQTTTGLVWGYNGGQYNGVAVADGTVTLTASTTNYIVVNRTSGVVSTATTTTNWNDSAYARLYKVTTGTTTIATAAGSVVDCRLDANGLLGGGGTSGGGSGTRLAPVRFATTAALATNTYANGTAGVGATLTASANGAFPTTDGVTPAQGDRLLVKDEATGSKNGLYALTTLGTGSTPWVLTRTTDADSASEIVPGIDFFVTAGTANGDKLFELTTDGTIVVGTTALTFAVSSGGGSGVSLAAGQLAGRGQASGTGVAEPITLGNGIVLTGTTLSANGGIYAAPHSVRVIRSVSAQSLPGGYSKIQFDTKVSDTSNEWDGTNYRVTPKVPGWYLVNVHVAVGGSPGYSMAAVYQNGALVNNGNSIPSGANRSTAFASVYCNGSTDYIEGWVYATGGSLTVATGAGDSLMSVFLVGASQSAVPTVGGVGSGSGDISGSNAYADLANTTLSIPASVGDQVEVELTGATYNVSAGASHYWQFVAGGGAFGETVLTVQGSSTTNLLTVRKRKTIVAADLSGGVAQIKVQWKGQGTPTMSNGASSTYLFTIKNFGDGSGVPARASRGVFALTDAATIAIDATFFDNFRVTLGGSRTLGNPTGLVDGQTGNIRIVQDGTGSRTLAYGSMWKFAGGVAPTLSTAAGAKDLLSWEYDATDGTIFATLNKAFA